MICDVSVISYWTAKAESLSNKQNQCTSFMQNNSCYLKFFNFPCEESSNSSINNNSSSKNLQHIC
jgi:hypothetical protein